MITLGIKIILIIIVLYLFIMYFYDLNLQWIRVFFLKYLTESIISFFVLGFGVVAIVKSLAVKNIKLFFDQIFYSFNRQKLNEHIVFNMLRNAKIKNRNYKSLNPFIVQITRKMILKEYRLAYRFLTNSLEFISKTNSRKFYSSNDIANIFEKDLKVERQMLYASLEAIFVNMQFKKAQVIKDFYETRIEHFLNPVYLQFYLLKQNDYSIFKSLELIMSQFWITYLSIDSEIMHIFNTIEKEIPVSESRIEVDTKTMEALRDGF